MGMPQVKGISVVDGTDGYTPVTTPKQGQILAANITLSHNDFIGTYPAPEDVSYVWKDHEGNQLGTGSRYTVTDSNVGDTIRVEVTFSGAFSGAGTLTWTASGPVA